MIDLFGMPTSTDIAWQWADAIMPDDLRSPYGQALTVFALEFLDFMTLNGIVQSAYPTTDCHEKTGMIFMSDPPASVTARQKQKKTGSRPPLFPTPRKTRCYIAVLFIVPTRVLFPTPQKRCFLMSPTGSLYRHK